MNKINFYGLENNGLNKFLIEEANARKAEYENVCNNTDVCIKRYIDYIRTVYYNSSSKMPDTTLLEEITIQSVFENLKAYKFNFSVDFKGIYISGAYVLFAAECSVTNNILYIIFSFNSFEKGEPRMQYSVFNNDDNLIVSEINHLQILKNEYGEYYINNVGLSTKPAQPQH